MENKKIKIGLVGCGTIGTQLARAIERQFTTQALIVAVCDTCDQAIQALQKNLSSPIPALPLKQLIAQSELIIEAASGKVSFEVARLALEAGKGVMLMSIGGILDKAEELFLLAEKNQARLYLPSGAIAGLDAVKAAACAGIKSITLTTRKPPQGLIGAPYLSEHNIDLSKISGETVIFEGKASEAVKGFPKNVNVCAVLSLAGVGKEKTMVRIVTSPEYTANTHEITVEGDFGKLKTTTENVPSPTNPKTSYLAALSAIAMLKDIVNVVRIGT